MSNFGIVILLLSCIVLWQFRLILLLIFGAIISATILNALTEFWQNKFSLNRNRAVAINLLTVVIAIALLLVFILPTFISQFQELISLIPRANSKIAEILANPPDWLPISGDWLKSPDWLPISEVESLPTIEDVYDGIARATPKLFENFLNLFSFSGSFALQSLLLLVLSLMLHGNPQAYRSLALKLIPKSKRKTIDLIFSLNQKRLIAWIKGMCVNSAFIALGCGLVLVVLGIPFAFSNGILAGIFNFIPNVGPMISLVFPISVALIDSPDKIIPIGIAYFIIQQIESYWLSPLVMKQQVNLLPAATLIAQIFFATFLGIPGLVLALPLTVVFSTWIDKLIVQDFLENN